MEQTNQNQFKCSGNCLNCLPAQRAYCASQHAYSNMKVLDMLMEVLGKMQEDIAAMQGNVSELAAKIEAIQNNEANIFDPNDKDRVGNPNMTITQSGDGAENRSPETI